MWTYEKKLQYPVSIKKADPELARHIITALGGADGEMAAANRYLHQRYAQSNPHVIALLTDIGTEEMSHMEIVSAIIRQLTKNLSAQQIRTSAFASFYADHTLGLYPASAAADPFMAQYFQSKGDPLTDLHEDLAAEQKARTMYENLLRLTEDDDVRRPLEFLRQREIVHYQRFGEALELVRRDLDCANYYAYNPLFDKKASKEDRGLESR
ncbi:MAG: manganese catalase family protein [Traorella sp.]